MNAPKRAVEKWNQVFRSSSGLNLKRTLLAFIAGIMLCGCADLSTQRWNLAVYDGIPVASPSEEEQAQRFTPLNHGNCLVYVVRKQDWYGGTQFHVAKVLLTPAESPLSPPELFTQYYNEVVNITAAHFVGNVYAMWELPPNTYVVTAVFNRNYPEFIGGWRRDVFEKSKQPGADLNWFQRHQLKLYMAYFAQAEIDCRPGVVRFIAVGDRGLEHHIVLEELTEAEGRTFIQNGIRSVGQNWKRSAGSRP